MDVYPRLARLDVHSADTGAVGMRRVVAVTVLALAVLSGCTTATSPSETPTNVEHPGTPQVDPTPSASPSPTEPALELGGVFVPVPERWLDPRNVLCGTAIRNAAYVVDPADPIDACAVTFDTTHVTAVMLGPIRPVPAWADGRTVVVRTFPDRGVRLIVRSPSKTRANALADGAFLVDEPDGCPIRAADLGTPPEPKELGTVVPDGAAATTVCGYRRGRLTQSQTLTEGQSAELTAVLTAAPTEDVVRPCPYVPNEQRPIGFWVVTLDDGSHVWQQRMSCVDVVVADDGTFAGLTNRLAEQLWQYAQGPVTWTNTPSR